MRLLSAGDIPIAPSGGFTGLGTLGKNQGSTSIVTFAKFISNVVGIMTIVAIIWFVFVLIGYLLGFPNILQIQSLFYLMFP